MEPIERHPLRRQVVLVGSIVPLVLILARILDLPQRVTIPAVVVAALVFGAMALWGRANDRAQGDEWWQDDRCSGWRGY